MLAIAEHILHGAGIAFKRLSVIQMNRSSPLETRFALLIFVDHDRTPLALIKASPDPEEAKRFEQEFNNLSFLCCHGNSQFIKTIPKPLYFRRFDNFTILAETVMPGTRMKNFPPNCYFSSRRFDRHFADIVQWLYKLYQSVANNPTYLASPDFEDQLTMPLREYRDSYRLSSDLNYLFDTTVECLAQADIPMTPWHRDFCTANILVTDAQQISVIDWENPLIMSWPLSDLLYFISSCWCIPYKKGETGLINNYRHLFFTVNRHADLIRKSVLWYKARLGIKTDLILPLSVIAWVLYANGKRLHMEKREKAIRAGRKSTEPLPLIMIEDNYCLNLEILVENRESYILNTL